MNGSLFDGLAPDPATAAGWFTAHCDGGSRGNPGPSGYGVVIEDPQGRVVARLSEFLGRQTNNYAEYCGLVAALKWAVEHGAVRMRVVSDSELMVKQMKGEYRVKNAGLVPVWNEARRLVRSLAGFEMTHTLRAGNAEADRLANEAMDRGMGKNVEHGEGNRDPGDVRGGPRAGEAGNQAAGVDRRLGRADGDPTNLLPRSNRQVLEGYVKDGVVHLLNGELPDGVFVKVIRE